MTERAMRIALVAMAAGMLLSLFGVLAWPGRPRRPDDPKKLAAWLAEHPADWIAASDLTEAALDLDLPSRFELWHRAHDHALMLAPQRAQPRTAFVRSGFFHWYELDDAGRQQVLAEAIPILHDAQTFYTLAPVIWRLTRDFAYLRRASGGDYSSLTRLRDIAATNGLFSEYRDLRDRAVARRTVEFEAKAAGNAPFDPTEYVRLDANHDDEPLLLRVLTEFHDHPIEKRPSNPLALDRLIDYAIRHHLQPLDGLQYAVRDSSFASAAQRARLAVAFGDLKNANIIESAANIDDSTAWNAYLSERAAYERARGDGVFATAYAARASLMRAKQLAWSGRCNGDQVCTSAQRDVLVASPAPYAITLARAAGDEVPPYVEVYVDDARIGEAPIASQQTFTSGTLAPGPHHVYVRVVNPFTRNLAQRRVQVLRDSP